MCLVGLFIDDPVIELVLGHGEHPGAALYRAGRTTGRPLRVECRDSDVVVTLGVRPVSPADTLPVGRMMVCEEPGTDEVPLIRQRVGAYGIMLSEQSLLGTVMFRLIGVSGAWNLPGDGPDAGEEPTAGLLREVHEETGQQVIPGRLLTFRLDRWVGRAPSGGLEDYRALRIIYSAICEKPNHPCIHDLGGSTARID